MFKDDDDEEEDGSIPISKYPCMPSLGALQQMRNRLHLAHLGKKLMKWTAMATGREMRKLASELELNYKTFREDTSNAFILLARARYFYSNLNKMVVENVNNKAIVTIAKSSGTVSCVRVLQFNLVETGAQPYAHLGLEKGGEAIKQAKLCWLNLLKKLVLLLQQRANFKRIEEANKSATKRKNVLIKVIIPRIYRTIQYILAELEEIAREELYRIKKVKQNKVKYREKKNHKEIGYKCPICGRVFTPVPMVKKVQKSVLKSTESIKAKSEELRSNEDLYSVSKQNGSLLMATQFTESKISVDSNNLPCYHETSKYYRLDYLSQQLNKIISLSDKLTSSGFTNSNLISKPSEDLELTMKNILITEVPGESAGSNVKCRVERLKLKLRDIVNMVCDLKDRAIVTPSVEQFIGLCEKFENKIDICLKMVESNDVKDSTINRLNELNTNIDSIMKVIEECKDLEFLSLSGIEFCNSCRLVKYQIDKYIHDYAVIEKQKTDNLRKHESDLENKAPHVKQEGIATFSLEGYVAICKNFKLKIEEYKIQNEFCNLYKLMNHIDDTIEFSTDVKNSGFMSQSIEQFIRTCEGFKKNIELKKKVKTDEINKAKSLNELRYNIENIMSSISKSKEQGLLVASVEDLIKACEKTKAKIDEYERYSLKTDKEGKMLYPTCSEVCTCNTSDAQLTVYNCLEPFGEETNNGLSSPPCDFCREILKRKSSKELLCESCNQIPLEEQLKATSYTTAEHLQDHFCDVSKKRTEERESTEECEISKQEENTENVNNSLGYYEKNVQKITRVKRTRNLDGSIVEETETILIKREKHDPNVAAMIQDENEFLDISNESLKNDTNEDVKKVGVCITKNQNQQGFINTIRRVKSEMIHRASTTAGPCFRQCISEFTKRPESMFHLGVSSTSSDDSMFGR